MKPILILSQGPGDNTYVSYIMGYLHQLGIPYEHVDITQTIISNTHYRSLANETNYSGCILPTPNATVDDLYGSMYLAAHHPWPVLVMRAISCYNGATYYKSGQSTRTAESVYRKYSTYDGGTIYEYQLYPGTVSRGDASSTVTYTDLIYDPAHPELCYAWRRTETGSADRPDTDVIYLNTPWDALTGLLSPFVMLGYYLNDIGATIPHPIRFQVDIDDIQDAPAANCLTEVSTWLRAHNSYAVCGVNPASSLYAAWLADGTVINQIKANADVLLPIIHNHGHYTWSDDTDYPTEDAAITTINADIAALTAATGLPIKLHIDGYAYGPSNGWTPRGARALAKAGVKAFRIGSDVVAQAPQQTMEACGPRLAVNYPTWMNGTREYHVDLVPHTGGLYGYSSGNTWVLFTGDSDTVQGAQSLMRILPLVWLSYDAQIMMCHGPNLSVDGDTKILHRFLDEMLESLISFTGGSIIRMRTRDEILL